MYNNSHVVGASLSTGYSINSSSSLRSYKIMILTNKSLAMHGYHMHYDPLLITTTNNITIINSNTIVFRGQGRVGRKMRKRSGKSKN